MNWAESFFSYCWCWRTNLGFYWSDLSGKHCPHLATVMSATNPCQMIHDNDNDITALLLIPPLLSSTNNRPQLTSHLRPQLTSDLTPHSSCTKQIQKNNLSPVESKVVEKHFLVGSQVRSEARYLPVNLSILTNFMLRRNRDCPL